MEAVFEEIERLIWDDTGGRGLIPYALRGEVKKAAISLLSADHVMIVSGFYIERSRTGETDGPLGAIFLAQALERLGIRVTLLTSAFNFGILCSAVQELQLHAHVLQVQPGEEAVSFPRMLEDKAITHLVAIEQMGAAIDGRYYNMRGDDVSHSTARFDSLFLLARQNGIATIGIGDGGNEIGMGELFASIHEQDDFGHIACITPTDFLIVAGISNWGAYGLVAGLSYLTRQPLLHSTAQEARLLEVVLEAGAVDGRTLERSMSVDAVPISDHLRKVHALWAVYERSLEKVKTG